MSDNKCWKRGHVTRAWACRARDKMELKQGVPLRVYKCDRCGKWHIGRSKYWKLMSVLMDLGGK